MSQGVIVQSLIKVGYVPNESLCSAILGLSKGGVHGNERRCVDCGRWMAFYARGEETIVLGSASVSRDVCSALGFLERSE